MKKIGILGGTFNPIHNGHLLLAQAAYEHCCLDEVWFIPSGKTCLKERECILSAEHRLEMTKLAMIDIAHFTCSEMELNRKGYTYTVDTLYLLHARYPNDIFYYIMGADSFLRFPNWKDSKKIASMCTLVTVIRDDVDAQKLLEQKSLVEKTLGAKVIMVPFQRLDISSGKIREMISKGESTLELLPKRVMNYIEKHGLYKEKSCG